MNKANLVWVGVVVALILGSVGAFKSPSQNVVKEVIREVGAMPGNTLNSESFTVNGMTQYFYSQSFQNFASSTACSFKTPTASTTVAFLGVKLSGSTGGTQIVSGKATNSWATTTALMTLTGTASSLLEGIASSTVWGNNTLVDNIMPPNVYVNTSIMTNGTATGTCKMILNSF